MTTVIGGNCGFSLAPAGPDHSDYLSRMMARVEGMPLAALEQGLDWSWTTFGDWIGRLDGRLGVNAGFLVGHSTLRRAAMGDAAVGRPATPDEIEAMVSLAHRSMDEGALGLSTSQAHTHHDGEGNPVPSRSAGREELEALAGAVRDHAGTTFEIIVPGCLNGFSEEEVELMATLSLLANRPVNWNVLGVSALNPGAMDRQLAASTAAAERGATVVALTMPHTLQIRLSFLTGAILDGLPGWREVLALPVPSGSRPSPIPRCVAASTKGPIRRRPASSGPWPTGRCCGSTRCSPRPTMSCEGRTVGEVATERGQDPFDAMLDVVVADGLRTGLRPPIPESEADWELRARAWLDPRTVVGGSDAGAHLDVMCGAIYRPRCRARECASEGSSTGSRLSTNSPRYRPGSTACATGAGWPADGVRTWCSSTPNGWAMARAHPERPARRGQPPLRRGRGDRARPGQRHRDHLARVLHR